MTFYSSTFPYIRLHRLTVILIMSVVVTLLLQINLTKAIFFEGYLKSDQIIEGRGLYLDFIIESSKGNWHLGSPYLKEWRNNPYLYPALNIHIGGLVKSLGGLDAKTTTIVLHYGALFVMIFCAFTASLVLFKWHPFGYLVAFSYIFMPGLRGWVQLVSPEINFIFFFLFLAFFFSSLSFWKREIGLGLITGFLFYIYPYHWTYALPLLTLCDAWESWKIRHIDKRRTLKYFLILGIASLYFKNLFTVIQFPYYAETMARIGLIRSCFPAGIGIQIFVAVLLAGWIVSKKLLYRLSGIMGHVDFGKVVAGLLVTFIVLNQQIITGRELEFNSHYYAIIMFFVVAFLGGISLILIQRGRVNLRTRWIKTLLIALWTITTVVFIGRWIFSQNKTNVFNVREAYWTGDTIEVAKWFHKNGIKDAVVYAPIDFSEAITELSENYLVFNPNQVLFLTPNQELINRFTYFDITNVELTENLILNQNMIFGHFFDAKWQKDNVRLRVNAFLKNESFRPRPLSDYIAFDFSDMYQKRKKITPEILYDYFLRYNVEYAVFPNGSYDKFLNSMPVQTVFKNSKYKIIHIKS